MARIQPIVVKTTVVLKLNSGSSTTTSSDGVKRDSSNAVEGRRVEVGWVTVKSLNFK
jgi:hypothetical protein